MAANRVADEDDDPLRYWLSTLPADTRLDELVATAKPRWRIQRDYRELKQELGLAISMDGVGGAFTIMPACASPPTDSSSPNER